ncbi:hypothetical protein ABIA30_004812 [Mycobacterium sp. MAA66]
MRIEHTMWKQRLSSSVVVTAISLAIAATDGAIASAQPPVLPFMPGAPGVPYPGGYSYQIGTGTFSYPPHTTDNRGVRTAGVTADPSQTSTGLPNDKPGAGSPNQSFWLNFDNARYGIQGGIVPPDSAQAIAQTTTGIIPGVVSSGGPWPEPLLESPSGTPPKTGVPTGEVTNPTPPSYPQLEAPSTPPPAAPAPSP